MLSSYNIQDSKTSKKNRKCNGTLTLNSGPKISIQSYWVCNSEICQRITNNDNPSLDNVNNIK